MANEIALTTAQIAPCFPEKAQIFSAIASSAITKGEAVYPVAATGKVAPADANGGSPLNQPIGVALKAAAANDVLDILKEGHCYGYTLSGMNYGDPIYLSDTVGDLSTAVGTVTVTCGKVAALTDGSNLTKVAYFNFDWNTVWA
jgi:hypothetical protein